ncbi:MAG: HEPN domain-containing protein [Candidatus Caldarchaeum sp.]
MVELVSRARDWMRQAVRDLAHAEASLSQGDYEWACFAAQQAAEKAVKALYESRNMEAWGHSVSRLLEHLPEDLKPAASLLDKAKELDRHYIPTRYPNLHSEGAPLDYYTRSDAERAVEQAREVVEFCRSKGVQA